MVATEVVISRPRVISPFRAQLTITGRRAAEVWQQILHNKTAMAGLSILVFFVFLALAAPWIAPYGPLQPVNDAPALSPPSPQHLMGVSRLGNDIFSQVIWGTQVSLLVGVLSAIVASVIGTAVGLFSGFVGGWVDDVIMRFNDVVLSIPWLVLMIIVAARLGTIDLLGITLVIGLTGWSVTARVIRSQVLSLKERMFVERAKMVGSSSSHILLRHIFPNAFPLIFANTILTVAVSILSESVLAFLNLSLRQNISWGRIVAEAQSNYAMTTGNPGWLIIPGLCIVFLVFGFYLFGYALDEILNPRLRRR
ncbi:MAG TPA: ABC transporter permease [Thermoplasmata archaeon]|nr:ABC transporter permease [Thermoplasmata archaeon]